MDVLSRILPRNKFDNEKRRREGIQAVLNCIRSQIENPREPLDDMHITAARIFELDRTTSKPQEKSFPNDIIMAAIPYIREAGYYVWEERGYSSGRCQYHITITHNSPWAGYKEIEAEWHSESRNTQYM